MNIFPQSSTTYLTKAQVRSLSNYQLGIARNEIYQGMDIYFNQIHLKDILNLKIGMYLDIAARIV